MQVHKYAVPVSFCAHPGTLDNGDPYVYPKDQNVDQGAIPAVIAGKYEIIGELGRGGFGTVLKARNPQLNKTVAIKVLHATLVLDANIRARFEQEAKAGAGLAHPNLIPVFDYGFTERGEPFLVMEYVEGMPLSDFVESKKPAADDLVELLIQVAKALRYLHENKIVHRDLKTSNILVQEIGGERYARLLDLGIAKVFAREETEKSRHLTSTGMVFGSPMYMSPEQCEGRAIDARSDIYSFGCVIYECLSGRAPFDGDNSLQVILKHLQQAPEPLHYKDLKQSNLGDIAKKCLEKAPEQRYQSMTELLNALQNVAETKIADRASAKLSGVSRAYVAPPAPDMVAPERPGFGGVLLAALAFIIIVACAVPVAMNFGRQAVLPPPTPTQSQSSPSAVQTVTVSPARPTVPATYVAPPVVPAATIPAPSAPTMQEAEERIHQERLATEKAAAELRETQKNLEAERLKLEAQSLASQEAARQAQFAATLKLQEAANERFKLVTQQLKALERPTQNLNAGNDAMRRMNRMNQGIQGY